MRRYRHEPNDSHEERWQLGLSCIEKADAAGAVFVYEALANDGCAPALAQLGSIYEHGVGELSPDFNTAATWYKHSVEVLDPASSHLALARMYMQSKELDPDHSLATYHLNLLDNNDIPAAAFGLGMIHEHGVGVTQDFEIATKYYSKAASLGHVEAEMRLAHLKFKEAPFANFLPLYRASRKVKKLQAKSPNDPGLGLNFPEQDDAMISFSTENGDS